MSSLSSHPNRTQVLAVYGQEWSRYLPFVAHEGVTGAVYEAPVESELLKHDFVHRFYVFQGTDGTMLMADFDNFGSHLRPLAVRYPDMKVCKLVEANVEIKDFKAKLVALRDGEYAFGKYSPSHNCQAYVNALTGRKYHNQADTVESLSFLGGIWAGLAGIATGPAVLAWWAFSALVMRTEL